MSNAIDQRVVEMQFNNKQFESGIQTSLKSLSQLEKGLRLDGAKNGLAELDKATKSFTFEGLAHSVDAIASKFTGLGIIGVTAMQNIANSMYHTAKNMATSLTIEPIKTGFAEYETQINAVQTILANTQNAGKTLTDVTRALDELNSYADKTIYNFTEMTRNIGTFTAAGVDLETATNSIQGIANLAAISGSTSQQASTAMYQLSQAMASGTVKLMDWNSVVNAGMGGQVFQDALKETARAHGIAIDKMIEDEQGFRNTLQEGWLTTDILTETLEKFTATTEGLTEEQIQANREMWKARGYTEEQIDAIFEMGKTATDAATKVKTFTQLFDTLKEAAQSGWTQSWETVVGDFEEAKELLTAISDEMGAIINTSAQARNELLQGWKDIGGRDDLIAGFKNLYETISTIVSSGSGAFGEIFPSMEVGDLKDFTQGFEDVTKQMSDVATKIAPQLKRAFKGAFALFDIGAQGLSALASGFADVLGFAAPIGGDILEMAASLGDFLVELADATRETGFFEAAIGSLTKGADKVIDFFSNLSAKGREAFSFLSDIDLSGIELKLDPLKAIADAGAWAIEKLEIALGKAMPIFATFGGYVSDAFGQFSDAITQAVQDGSFQALLDIANGGLLAALITGVMKVADAFRDIADNAGGFLENISGIFEGVGDALSGLQNKLNADALKSIAISIGILAASLAGLSMIDQGNLGAALGSVTAMFVELIAAMGALALMADGNKLSGLMKLGSLVSSMKGLATALLILSAAMAVIGSMDASSMANSLIATVSLIGMMTIAIQKLGDGSVQMMKGASSLIAFAAAIGVLALSVKMLGEMDPMSLIQGLAGLGGVLLELGAFLAIADLSSLGVSSGVGLMAAAAGILILSFALKTMGSMDISELGTSMLVFAGGMGILVAALQLMPSNMMSIGAGLLLAAGAMVILAGAIKLMGSTDPVTLAAGLITLGLALTEIAIAANFMQGTLAGSAAMLVMSVALVALGVAMKIICSIPFGTAITGLITLAGALAVMGAAGALLAPVVPAMLATAAGILAMSVAVAAGGAALLVFGAGLTAASAALTAFAAAVVATVTAVVGALPVIAEQLAATIVAIADGISAAAPACSEAASAFIQAIVDVIANGVLAIADAVGTCVPALMELIPALVELGAASAQLLPYAPAMAALSAVLVAFGAGCGAIAAGVLVLSAALEALGLSGLAVASALTDIYTSVNSMGDLSIDAVISAGSLFQSAGKEAAKMIMQGLEEGLSGSQDVMTGLIESLVSVAEGASGNFSSVGESLATAFASALSSALQNGVATTTSGMVSSMNGLVNACVAVLTAAGTRFYAAGSYMISSLTSGVNSRKGAAVSAVSAIGSSMASSLSGFSSQFKTIGSDLVQGLINGVNAKRAEAIQAAYDLGVAMKNATKQATDTNSPSKDFEDIGMWIDVGLANGLRKFASLAADAATHLGESTITPVMTMTDGMISELGSMGKALRGTAQMASALSSNITTEQRITVNHSFADLTVKGVNDKQEFVAVANYSVESMLTDLMRKGIRR